MKNPVNPPVNVNDDPTAKNDKIIADAEAAIEELDFTTAEAQVLWARSGLKVWSNVPLDDSLELPNPRRASREHTALDLGDDAFTVGRPHPMIDQAARIERLLAEAADPSVRVILLDVVIGWGAHADPAAELAQAKADVAAMQAAAAQARLNVDFTRVTAPISGRVGAAMITTGNLVDPSALLTTMVSLDPIQVYFEGDERTFLRHRGQGEVIGRAVRIGLADEQGHPHEGVLDFIDNQLDPATGTIRARARLANPERRFTPGLFARVQLTGGAERQALLIHDQAVLTDQDRKYVYVVGEGNTALRKDVVLGGSVDGLRIVESGLAAGDRVVVNGMKKIFFPGAPLQPVSVPMDAPNTVVEQAPAPGAQAGGM